MPDGVKIVCNRCDGSTFHGVAHEQIIDYPEFDDNGEFLHVESRRVRLLVCKGCNTPSYEEAWNIGHHGDAHGLYWQDVDIYPERTVAWLRAKRFAELPRKLKGMYTETLQAYNRDLLHLCTVGLRCLIEGICDDQGVVPEMPEGKHASIYSKIEGLKEKLPTALVDDLHAFRFMGNLAAHHLSVPPKTDLQLAIAVIEDLMNFMYHLDHQASILAEKHNPRKKKQTQGDST